MTIWIDGSWRTRETAVVSVYDHGLLYGDGLFEGIKAYGGRIFRRDAHVRRLLEGCRALDLACPLDAEGLGNLMDEAVERETRMQEEAAGAPRGSAQGSNGNVGDTYLRLVLTRGEGPLGLDPAGCDHPSLILIADRIRLYPAVHYETGVAVVSSAVRRNPVDSLDPRMKSLNYLNNILAKIQARQAGAQEALMLNHKGFIAECTGDNVILVKDGRLRVPGSWNGALEGITLQAVLELAQGMGIPVVREDLTLYDAWSADGMILTGTAAELVPVATLDGRNMGGAVPVFQKLREAFRDGIAAGGDWFRGV